MRRGRRKSESSAPKPNQCRCILPDHGNVLYALEMDDPNDADPATLTRWVRERFAVLMGVVALFAWLALLWFMFGDVL